MEQPNVGPEASPVEALRPSDAGAEGIRSSARLGQDQGPLSGYVPSSRHNREVQVGVRALVELQHASILRVIGRLLLFLGLPLAFLISFAQLRLENQSLPLLVEVLSLLVATAGCRLESLRLQVRKPLVSIAFVFAAIASLVHFGPLLGVGFIFVFTLLVGAVLLERHQAALMALSLALGIVGTAAVQLYLPQFSFASEIVLDERQWIRVAATSCLCLFAVLFVFHKMQANLWLSLEKEITGRLRERRLVAEREKVLRGAAATQRLESLGRLAGGVAHDFNNALVVIQCGIEALQDDLDEEERGDILDELRAGVDRAANTAKQLLSFAKRNVEDIGEAHPQVVLERLTREAKRLFPAHVELEVSVQAEAPRVAISEASLDQMVFNLVNNSLDALGADGGKVKVSAALEPQSGGLLLCVEDNGPGIDSGIAEQVFEPFFTTKGDRATGLGLATVWGIVHRHGGEVTMDSVVGQGTRVSLHLPACASAPAQSPHQTASMPSKQDQKARILVLEDEAPVRTALRRILKNLDYDVAEASTVAEARKACTESDFSLLISDGVVPDGGVGAFIVEFRARQDGAPVILCSGYLEEDLAIDGIAQGNCAFLAKPFAATELTALVQKLLQEERGPETMSSR